MDEVIRNLERQGLDATGIIKILLPRLETKELREVQVLVTFMQQRTKLVWTTAAGEKHKIKDLSDNHLQNILRCLDRGGRTLKGDLVNVTDKTEKLLLKELKYRELPRLEPLICDCGHSEYRHERNFIGEPLYRVCTLCECTQFLDEYRATRLQASDGSSADVTTSKASGSSDTQ